MVTSSMYGRLPNHLTHAESHGVVLPSGAFTILPGHAGWPRAAPHTNSPIQNGVVVEVKTVLGADSII